MKRRTTQGPSHLLVSRHGRGQVAPEPPLQLLQIREGEGLHLGSAQVVVPSFLHGAQGCGEAPLEGLSGLGQRVQRQLHGAVLAGGYPVTALQGVVEDAGPPLRAPLLAVEEAVLPKLHDHPDPEWQAGVQRLGETFVIEDVAEPYLRAAGLGIHREVQGLCISLLAAVVLIALGVFAAAAGA